MRRRVLAIVILSFFAACGKNVPVASRSTVPSSPQTNLPQSELQGLATYYAEPYHGQKTANGEIFDSYRELTAAHRTLPFNSVVKVTNQSNGREVDVRINDRGPFVEGRVIDLSWKAAQQIDMVRSGTAPVKLTVIKEGSGPRGAVPAATASSSSPSGAVLYTIQVGAFERQDTAEALQKRLELHYRDVMIQTFSTDRTFYRVRVGRLSDLPSAEKLVKQLRGDKFDPFVVRLN
jgi:rare lipoprotein A